jgi:hypothetical protein
MKVIQIIIAVAVLLTAGGASADVILIKKTKTIK